MPNTLAYAALLIWPIVTLFLFVAMSSRRAIIWSLLAAYLLLPPEVTFDFSGVPPLNKYSIPSIVTAVLAAVLARRGEFRWPRGIMLNLLILSYIFVPFMTGMNNRAPFIIGTLVIPGVSFYDSLSSCATNLIELLPFILGIGFLNDENSHRDLLRIFVIAALAYSIPVLSEIRLSPWMQFRIYHVNNVIYFLQQIRGGGFRAMVFLGHGLLLSTFLAMAVLAAVGLWRQRTVLWGVSAGLAMAYLAAVLVLNKSSGAIILTLAIGPCLYFMRPRHFLTLTCAIAALIVSYPLMRGFDLVPTQTLLSAAGEISANRRASLALRFVNEDLLLKRANEKAMFGWGSFGRNRVAKETNYGTTVDISVTDGTWVIMIGSFGWVGFLSLFGLLCYPFWRGFKMRNQAISLASVTLVAMHLLNVIDLIPNSSLRPMTWLVAGALSGVGLVRQARRRGRRAPQFGPTPEPVAAGA